MVSDIREETMRGKLSLEASSAIEDAFRAEAAASLGRVETILMEKLRMMNAANARVLDVLKRPTRDVPDLLAAVEAFNKAQQEAYDARMDLIIQRDSAGFSADNMTQVSERYPIPPQKRVRI